jgi:hypothetical protein
MTDDVNDDHFDRLIDCPFQWGVRIIALQATASFAGG